MRILLDGNKLPLNVRTTKDILSTIKCLAREMHWRTLYDPTKEIICISTINSNVSLEDMTTQVPVVEELESIRLQGKVICLDPGHGGSDPGAIGPSGTAEKDNTLAIALLLKEKLENNGATVILTHYPENGRALEDVQENLEQRLLTINDADADFFISIHNDSFSSSAASGTTTFHYGDDESIKLADLVQNALVTGLNTQNRGVRFASFYLLRYAKIPGIFVEAAFISNPEEEVLLASIDGRDKIADSIYQGIVKYYKV